jgi:hypothetical protein
MEVMAYTRHEENIQGGEFILPYYETTVSYQDMYGRVRTADINIPTDLGMIAYFEILEKLAAFAKMFKPGTMQAGRAWTDFYKFQKQYANVQHDYAGTIHTAQGKTINNTVVFDCDISQNYNLVEKNRILYTGCTRASERLWII